MAGAYARSLTKRVYGFLPQKTVQFYETLYPCLDISNSSDSRGGVSVASSRVPESGNLSLCRILHRIFSR